MQGGVGVKDSNTQGLKTERLVYIRCAGAPQPQNNNNEKKKSRDKDKADKLTL